MVRGVLVAVVASAIVVISLRHASTDGDRCTAAADGLAKFEATRPPHPAPDVPFTDGAGTPRTVADFRGHGIVLNFWATWCAPCVREMPSLDRLQAKVAADGIRVIAVSEDRSGAAAVEPFFRRLGIGHLGTYLDVKGRLMHRLALIGLPTTVLIDPNGNEIGRVIGAVEWDSPPYLALVRHCVAGRRDGLLKTGR